MRNASGKCSRTVVSQSKKLHLTLEGVEISFNTTMKYLGLTFDKLLKFNIHARTTLQKAKHISGMFSYLLNNKHLPQETKLLLYKVAIRSVLIYGFPIWFSISPIVAKELDIFERGILRKCTSMNYVSQTKNIQTLTFTKPVELYRFAVMHFSSKETS